MAPHLLRNHARSFRTNLKNAMHDMQEENPELRPRRKALVKPTTLVVPPC
jgi:hypothetical protein